MSAVARMNDSWDAIGMTEKEKLRSIKRVVKVREEGNGPGGEGGGGRRSNNKKSGGGDYKWFTNTTNTFSPTHTYTHTYTRTHNPNKRKPWLRYKQIRWQRRTGRQVSLLV